MGDEWAPARVFWPSGRPTPALAYLSGTVTYGARNRILEVELRESPAFGSAKARARFQPEADSKPSLPMPGSTFQLDGDVKICIK